MDAYTDKYAFWYCFQHDDGYLIKDNNIDDVPTWFKMCRGKCDNSDWYRKGVINYDGKKVVELEEVQVDYSPYGGTFQFEVYSYSYQVMPEEILLEDGTELAVGFQEFDITEKDHKVLLDWFKWRQNA